LSLPTEANIFMRMNIPPACFMLPRGNSLNRAAVPPSGERGEAPEILADLVKKGSASVQG